MLGKNMEIEMIMEVIGLPKEEIIKIKEETT